MNKQLYSNDITWYDTSVYNAITALDEKYPNAIPVFGGALGAFNYAQSDFKKFVMCIPSVVSNAKFYQWHEGAVGAVRRFCRICLVDPALVEVYLGMTIEELVG